MVALCVVKEGRGLLLGGHEVVKDGEDSGSQTERVAVSGHERPSPRGVQDVTLGCEVCDSVVRVCLFY